MNTISKWSVLYWHKSVRQSPTKYQNLSIDTKQFKSVLKNYLHAHSFYSVDEYLNVNRELYKIKLY
jgi:hypothetical protein